MRDYQVFYLFQRLNIDYYKFKKLANRMGTNGRYSYTYKDVANYIDAQISLREYKR